MLNKRKVAILIIVVSCIFLCMSHASANNITDDLCEKSPDTIENLNPTSENNDSNTFNDFQNIVNNADSDEINVTADYTFNDGDKPIIINKSLVINGNNHTFNALNKSGIFIIKANNVSIRNLNFINANNPNSQKSSYSQAIIHVNVDDSGFFSDNRYLIPIYDYADNIGGAIQCRGDNFSISDSRFENNYSPFGGAIYIEGNNSLINNSIFIKNHAYQGGAIYIHCSNSIISNSQFLNNRASFLGSGIYQRKGEANITDSTFTDNYAQYNATVSLSDKWNFLGFNSTYYHSFVNFDLINSVKINVENPFNNTYKLIISPIPKYRSPDNAIPFLPINYKRYSDYEYNFYKYTLNKTFFINIDGKTYSLKLNHDSASICFNSSLNKSNLILFNPLTGTNYTTTVSLVNNSFYNLQKLIDTFDEINLTQNYVFENSDDEISINRPVTINGNGHIIDARGKSRIFNIKADNVVIKNITLMNADGSIDPYKNNYIIFTDFIYLMPEYTRYGDFWWYFGPYVGYDAVVYNSSNFYDIVCKGKDYSYSGGAIHCRGNNLKVISSSFINNYAPNGGGIYISGTNSMLNNLLFVNNSANNGGAIYNNGANTLISNSQFDSNYARNYGSSISSYNNINIQNCNFTNDIQSVIFIRGTWQIDNMTSSYYNSFIKFGNIDFKFELTHIKEQYFNLKITFEHARYVNSYNKKFCLKINEEVYTLQTDSKSQANIKLILNPGAYTIKVYNPITKLSISKYFNIGKYLTTNSTVSINLYSFEAPMSIITIAQNHLIAKNKVFSKNAKVKKYCVTLKDEMGHPKKNILISLKINGKTFNAKTNKYGKATFKITKLKKGKYRAKLTVKDNQYTIGNNVKITVK